MDRELDMDRVPVTIDGYLNTHVPTSKEQMKLK